MILSGHIVDVNYRKNDLFCLIAKQINWRGGGGGGGGGGGKRNLKSRRKLSKPEAFFTNYPLACLSRHNLVVIFMLEANDTET